MKTFLGGIACVAFVTAAMTGSASAATRTFATPEAAFAALLEAAEKQDRKTVEAIIGPELRAAMLSETGGDDKVIRQLALRAARKRTSIESDPDDPAQRIVYIGDAEWPFPAPLVPAGKKWRFDGQAGIEEIVLRRIGRNELDLLDGCLGYVDAQFEYDSADYDDDGILEYAQRINSHPGKMDGLYWSTADGEPLSPIGPFAAAAAWGEDLNGATLTPQSGYYARILTAQGPNARGGARNYMVGDDLLAGFALVAWPAEYGKTGIKTFIVNQLGEVYEKDLGSGTDTVAKGLTTYDPDASWHRVSEDVLKVAAEQ